MLREVRLRNRLVVSPMCMYSSDDGFATDFHLVHLGSRALGGAGLVITEAAAVEPRGRISPGDLGIWKDEHVEMLARIAHFIESFGAVAGTQLAHAGRKGSIGPPWARGEVTVDQGGWIPVAPSAIRFGPHYPMPRELSRAEIAEIVAAFRDGARRSLAAGFRLTEIHAAHGYLIHEFLSPLTNRRTDEYGGSFENRIRFLLEIVAAVRREWPERFPLMVRISAVDWADNGWDLDSSVELAKVLARSGVDVVDCSSGALSPTAPRQTAPLYQVPFARRIRREANIKTAAVGLINTAAQAESVLADDSADLILLARQYLRDPHFPFHAAREFGAELEWPKQYDRAYEATS